MSKLDTNALWISHDRIPNLNRDFNMSRDPYIRAQILDMEQKDREDGGHGLWGEKQNQTTPALKPPTPHGNWLTAQRDVAFSLARTNYSPPNPHERNNIMNTTPKTERKAPLQHFKDGAVTVKLWEQSAGNKQYVNASVGKLYKDKATGEWHESRSFSEKDMLKLQAMLPEVRQEMGKWQDYYREAQQQKEQVQAMPDHAPQSTQMPSQQDMVAARDAAMQSVQPDQSQGVTQGHAPNNTPSSTSGNTPGHANTQSTSRGR